MSFGHLDLQQYLHRPLEFPSAIELKVTGNLLEYPEVLRHRSTLYPHVTRIKEEFIISEKGRARLPGPGQIGFVPEQTYLLFAFEFKLTPNSAQVFARTRSGREPIKTHGRFAFNDEGQVAIDGKDYVYIGVPWNGVNAVPQGNLIIDPVVCMAANEDTWLEST